MNYAYHKSVSICDVCVPFLSHTDLTELTDIISLDVNVFVSSVCTNPLRITPIHRIICCWTR